MFDRVQVIAIDEVDKVYLSELDRRIVEKLVGIRPTAQIVSASATIVRYEEATNTPGLVDEPTEWLKSDALQTTFPDTSTPRPFYSIQTENVFPSSVFHLVVDLRNLSPVNQDAVQLAWERMHTLRGDRFGPALIVWDVPNPNQNGRRDAICVVEGVRSEEHHFVVLNEKNSTVRQKFEDMNGLKAGRKTGAIGNSALTRGLDYPFKSVLISKNRPQDQKWSWDTYTHASGRCGREAQMLGISVVFICNEVRFDHCLQLHLPQRRHTAL
jgi:hypothetical protein